MASDKKEALERELSELHAKYSAPAAPPGGRRCCAAPATLPCLPFGFRPVSLGMPGAVCARP